ncbi:hypothetical protein FKM82_025523 [Ascaphus truei]
MQTKWQHSLKMEALRASLCKVGKIVYNGFNIPNCNEYPAQEDYRNNKDITLLIHSTPRPSSEVETSGLGVLYMY